MITKRPRNRRARRWLPLALGLVGAGAAAAVLAFSAGLGQAPGAAASAAVLSGDQLSANQLSASQSVGSGSGIATHYVLQGLPNCSYPAPANGLFVALSPGEYDNAAPCGSYLEVKGPNGSVRVKVIDQCPECKSGHIDLSEKAFAVLAPLVRGIIPVSYHTIVNPPLPAPVAFQVKSGSSRYWLALFVMNTGNAISSVQVETSPGHWAKLSRASWNGWIAQQGAGPGPFTVRVTDTQHHQVTIHNVALKPNAIQRTATWMYGHH